MKDYQEQYRDQADIFENMLVQICDELPGWSLVPADEDAKPVYTCRIRNLKCSSGVHELCAHYEVSDERICFSPSAWPQYTDTDGRKCSKRPNDLYGMSPRPTSPETRCKTYRGAGSIARQIQSKVIDEYMVLYENCCEAAHGAQDYTDKTNAGLQLISKACREEMSSPRIRSFYVREIEGELISVDFNSVGDVRLRLDSKEAASVINFLRSKRNRNSKRVQS